MTRPQGPPTFSIVIPAYNAERTIGSAIKSVLAQTREDFEVIVVDNGSTDATIAHVQAFLSDTRLGLIQEKIRGPSAARNAGLAEAKGRYVSFLDSDDLWMPNYLEVVATTLRANPGAQIAYTDGWLLDDATRRIFRTSAMAEWHPRRTSVIPADFLKALLERGNFLLISATVERSAIVSAGGFRVDLHRGEDWELWLRLSALGYRFVRCQRNLALYRRRPGQLTGDRAQVLKAACEVCRIVAEEYEVPPDIRELARRRMREQEQELASFRPRRPRRVPRTLSLPYKALFLLRWFYLKPPRAIRSVYPDLQRI
jgi:glycosyltransferase involved in cell wall biosynthesis